MNKTSTATNIGMAQLIVKRGDINANLKVHYDLIDEAYQHGVDVLIFPELSLTGYEPDLAQSLAIDIESNILDELKVKAIRYNMTIMVGAPKLTSGSNPQVALFIIDNLGVATSYSKMYLHAGEDVYFSRGNSSCIRTINNLNYSLAICADTSNEQHIIDSVTLQSKFHLASALISHTGYESDSSRLQDYARKYSLVIGLSNFIGESGGYNCAGKSGFYNRDGSILTQLPTHVTGIAIATYDCNGTLSGKSIITNRQAKVIRPHLSDYPNPISLIRGDNVKIGREDTEYVGWLFCTNTKTNISGWCPKQIIEPTKDDTGICLEDYSANELNVKLNQQLFLIKELNDWAWCFDGFSFGWVPLANLNLDVW